MFLKGLFYIVMIVLSGIFTLTALVLSIIKYSNNSKGAGKWLIAFGIGLVALFFSVALFTRGVINKTKEFVENISEVSAKQFGVFDSLNNGYNMRSDSILQSEQIKALMAMEHEEDKGNLPSQFYTYLGFKDYYRLPLRYPYSLHCMDSLGNAELFDEANVQQFDVNDNGEVFCEVSGISAFQFNDGHLIGYSIKYDGKKTRKVFFDYNFYKKELKEFKSEKELLKYAKDNGFDQEIKFQTCKSYYELF